MNESDEEKRCEHVPVLLAEVMAAARVQPGECWIDGTFGRGGHSSALLERGAQVLALDRDADAEPAARALEASRSISARDGSVDLSSSVRACKRLNQDAG